MSELGTRARELLHSGRELNRPTDADRDRIESALRKRLGAALLLVETGKVSPAIRPRWPFVASCVVGAGLVGAAVFFASRQQPVSTNTTRAVVATVAQASAAEPFASAVAPPSVEIPKAPEPIAAERPTPSTRPTEDRLAQEVALLARATSNLHAGRPADALKVLDEYQHRFPKGQLSEERRAARAQALCGLGRQSEARAELARLAPQSLAAARAKQVCDARSAIKN